MGKPKPKLVKPTLDKDLDKIAHVEEAAQHVSRGFAPLGIALIFMVLATVFAGALAMDRPGAWIIVAAAAIGAYMAMNIGANDVTNNVGPAVGSRAMTMGVALTIAVIFETAGALIAGGDVVSTISRGIVDPAKMPSADVFIWAMMASLLSSALWVNLATWIGAPVSTTHAVVGGVLGAGVAAAGMSAVDWGVMGGIAASWVVSPILGGVIAALFLAFIKEFIVYREDKILAAQRWVPLLIGIMTGSFTAYLALKGLNKLISISLLQACLIGLAFGFLSWWLSVPLIRRQSRGLENRNQSLRKLFQLPLIFAAALLSFAHGANDVANAIGPLSAIVHAAQDSEISGQVTVPFWVMIIGAAGISLGLLLFGPRLIRLVGEQITKLNPMRAFCVSLSAAITVIVASALGLPVSSTHIAVGAVFGVGFFREWYTRNSKRRMEYMRNKAERFVIEPKPERNPEEIRRRYLVRRSHFMTIVAAWIITVPASAGLAAVLYWVMSLIAL
ncbi:MAG: inorganic phosphate transporter [Alphaproteobacteria bacterium]|jgi:PiT family inorganic phosphate transporter|uniref:inorganic phosphate transporter n=1 Tax=Rhizobium/Agrobacterium group TaxID=227290 RepID=UPI0006B8FFEE|nr:MULTISPECIES: inorganic phosphate transporter [Rhizobium/Agrobacterium group]MBU0740538.1 inorganic phosphate transporter [Alphaproteobacteria bacterium]AOG08472.1 phosphate transporter family protein [Agrobacterium sp. RAC06]KPF59671.1 inorganic phosphate transporter [Rhizobium sp. AAP116]MBU0831344.1 inorganic phosphate transporter [Alphaproteobacteria bacterium]MBU1765459.1 inorganic phosphate transporter [Alphaproteobacteria bacterium]